MLFGAVLAAVFGRQIVRGISDASTLSWPLQGLTVLAFALFGDCAKRRNDLDCAYAGQNVTTERIDFPACMRSKA